jgi:dihydroxy-acid dehydratase
MAIYRDFRYSSIAGCFYSGTEYMDGVIDMRNHKMHSQQVRSLSPEMDSLRLGMQWSVEDLEKPQVLVESTFGDSHPGSAHLYTLVDKTVHTVNANGGKAARYFATDICDGMAQGHNGINYSLASRDILADLMEIHGSATGFDSAVFIASCDKSIPAQLMAIGRLNIPAVMLPGGVMKAGPDLLTLEQIGKYEAMAERGEISQEKLHTYKLNACPSCGACSFMGTACTMQIMAEALGLAMPGSALIPVDNDALPQAAEQAGLLAMQLAETRLTPKDIVTKDSFENAVLIHAAISGSTNALLHLPAIANEFGFVLEGNDFDRMNRNARWLANIRPAGQYPAEFFYYAGGVPRICKELQNVLHMDALTVTGCTLSENLRKLEEGGFFQSCEQQLAPYHLSASDVIKPVDQPLGDQGAISVLYGNLAPDGCVIKHSAVAPGMFQAILRARPFDQEEDALSAVLHGNINAGDAVIIRYEGPKGSGMPEMFYTTEAIASDVLLNTQTALITDGRFSGATRGPAIGHVSPEAAENGPLAFVEENDLIELDIPGRRLMLVGVQGKRKTPSEIEAILASRKAKKQPYIPKYTHGVLGVYTQLAVSPMKGGMMRPASESK